MLAAFLDVPEGDLPQWEAAHRESMAAENLIGLMLESYVATLLEPEGWIWCCGNTVRAIDFLKKSSLGLGSLSDKEP